jgi:hypothetical protein
MKRPFYISLDGEIRVLIFNVLWKGCRDKSKERHSRIGCFGKAANVCVIREVNSHVSLLSELDLSELGSVGHHVLVLDAHNTTTPGSSELVILVVLSAEVLGENLEVLEVLLAHLGEGDAGGGLLVNKLAEACLALDEGEGNALLSAESGEENEELNGVNVVSHNNELGLALLNELGNVVETELDDDGLGGLLGISTTLLGLSLLLESFLLLLVRLGLVFSEQFKELRSYSNINYKY